MAPVATSVPSVGWIQGPNGRCDGWEDPRPQMLTGLFSKVLDELLHAAVSQASGGIRPNRTRYSPPPKPTAKVRCPPYTPRPPFYRDCDRSGL